MRRRVITAWWMKFNDKILNFRIFYNFFFYRMNESEYDLLTMNWNFTHKWYLIYIEIIFFYISIFIKFIQISKRRKKWMRCLFSCTKYFLYDKEHDMYIFNQNLPRLLEKFVVQHVTCYWNLIWLVWTVFSTIICINILSLYNILMLGYHHLLETYKILTRFYEKIMKHKSS